MAKLAHAAIRTATEPTRNFMERSPSPSLCGAGYGRLGTVTKLHNTRAGLFPLGHRKHDVLKDVFGFD
jgi:hypothetical protein